MWCLVDKRKPVTDVNGVRTKPLCHFLTYLKGYCVLVRVEIIHMSKFLPETVEKNSSTIGPPAGIEPTPLHCSEHKATEVADRSKRN